MKDLKQIVEILKEWIESRKVGSVQINFFKGGISSIKFEETVKLPKQKDFYEKKMHKMQKN